MVPGDGGVMRNGPAVNEPDDAHLLVVRPAQTIAADETADCAWRTARSRNLTKRIIYNPHRHARNATGLFNSSILRGHCCHAFLLESGAHAVPAKKWHDAADVQWRSLIRRIARRMTPLIWKPCNCAERWRGCECSDHGWQYGASLRCGCRERRIVQFLVDHGAGHQRQDQEGRTPLDWAEGRRPGGLGNREKEAPHDTTIALLQKADGGWNHHRAEYVYSTVEISAGG